MPKTARVAVWMAVAVAGALSVATIALHRGEEINAMWLVVAAVCSYAIGYRFYSKFIAARVLTLDALRATPAERLENGRDFVRTNKWVVFGHHFAAIAGPGPLVGPVLAAQFGYLPGTLWILAGAVFGGCVQDFVILLFSVRRDGKSLTEMAKDEIGTPRRLCRLRGRHQHHRHPAGRLRADCRQRAESQSLGNVHHRDDHPHRAVDGRLPAPAASRAKCWKPPSLGFRPGAAGDLGRTVGVADSVAVGQLLHADRAHACRC